MFVGRADRLKGLMDLAEIAFNVEEKIPNRVRWIVCGDGPDLEDLRRKVIELGIERKFEIMGHTVPSKLIGLYEKVNACIVPTRSEFSEGLAMTVIESVLARRPVITSSVVPALELMRPACLEANTDDCISYADAVISIASDEILYQSLRLSAPDRLREFLSSEYSLVTALCRAFIGIR
jgi:glycosyltransferase involved in cell wall biosynthesis